MKKILILFLSFMVNIGYSQSFLQPEDAFKFNIRNEKNKIEVYISIEDNYHLYKDSIKFKSNSSSIVLDEPIMPNAKIIYNKFLNKSQEEYTGDILIEIPFKGKGILNLTVESQGCADTGLCYSPLKIVKNIKIK